LAILGLFKYSDEEMLAVSVSQYVLFKKELLAAFEQSLTTLLQHNRERSLSQCTRLVQVGFLIGF